MSNVEYRMRKRDGNRMEWRLTLEKEAQPAAALLTQTWHLALSEIRYSTFDIRYSAFQSAADRRADEICDAGL
jgi:hypothetical protein